LGELPRKVYRMKKVWYRLKESRFGVDLKRREILDVVEKVFSLLSVGSKRFLVNKVDRSVTGLIAQQQCVGMCQVPISNYSVVAQSYFGYTGIVTSVGEQPIKGLVSPEVMSRLCVGEMLCNMMGCVVSRFEGGLLKQDQIEDVLGEPTELRKWVWVEGEDREKKLDKEVPNWRKIVFDGKKIRITKN